MSLGDNAFFLGLDCRTERTRDEILSQETYDLVFDRCRRELISGQTRHLIVLLGVPIAYPRLVWLENVLTSRALDPIKALTRFGMLSNFVNKFDGGVGLPSTISMNETGSFRNCKNLLERSLFASQFWVAMFISLLRESSTATPSLTFRKIRTIATCLMSFLQQSSMLRLRTRWLTS
jgi:hypothetical protein